MNILLQFDTTDFWKLNWYYPIAILISLSGLFIAYKNYIKKNPSKEIDRTPSNSIPITITNNFSPNEKPLENINEIKVYQDDRRKSSIKILFVDDNYSEYKMVSILKKAGWVNTKGIKDVTDLDNNVVTESDIIFVDINGVGITMFQDQGLGLATALKNKYPSKKIVLYSAENLGDRFHKALRQVDDCLSKNAEPYQFIDLIENLSKNIG